MKGLRGHVIPLHERFLPPARLLRRRFNWQLVQIIVTNIKPIGDIPEGVHAGYSNPTTLVFYGYVGTQKATLVQNLNQLNFLLLAVKKADPEKPPRRIGFSQPTED